MRMLVIDDEEDICETIAEIASTYHFQVSTISNPDSVAGALAQIKPDFIMLDLMMPGIDGVEMLRTLAEFVKDAKICLISGSDTRVLNSARRLGSAHGLNVIAALEKPIDVSALRTLFNRMSAGGSDAGASDIAQAIAAGQIMLHYQPVINMRTNEVKGMEALARWAHPSRGTLMPDAFLEQIVNDGLMQALTEHVINTAVRQLAAWDEIGEKFTLSINVTASALLDLGLPDRIADLCKKLNAPIDRLILEVTETEAMRDVTRTMDVLLRMRIRNIGVSIDDFGTGHSSLRELQRMPFSEMKIDKSFVLDMVNNKDCAVIVNSIIDLGHNLGLKVIAEGVEDLRTWRVLAEKGCDYAQGYFMSKALPPGDVVAWLKSWREKPASV
jgi:EAL domain-containing protein (putative c-di-GMP-specific phosphodiesterase class I)